MTESNGIRQLGSGRYQARYRFAPGARRTRTASFDKRADAKTWLVNQQATVRSGIGVDPRNAKRTVGVYFDDWLERQHKQGPSTHEQYRRKWRKMLAPTFAEVRFADLSPSMVERWQARTLERYAPRTVAGAQTLLSQVVTTAVRDGLVATNRVAFVVKPMVSRDVVEAPDAGIVAALFDRAPEHLEVAVHLALGAGLRSGELRGLTVDRVDFTTGLLTIDRQLLCHPPGHVFAAGVWHHGREAFAPPKGRKARVVPVEAAVVDAVERHLARRRAGVHGLIVTGRAGGPMGRGSWDWEWARLRESAGIPTDSYGVHQLRHAYASWLIADGENLADVSRNLGHARQSFTLDMYVHPSPPAPPRSIIDRVARGSRVVVPLVGR